MSSGAEFLRELDFPVADITPPDLRRPFSVSIQLSTPAAFLGDATSKELIADAANKAWQEHLRKGRKIFNRPDSDAPGLVRCLSLRRSDDALVVGVQPTWFWTMLGTNLQLRAGRWDEHASMVEVERNNPADVSASRLANCLSVNLIVLSDDRPPKVLIQRRGTNVAVAAVPYQCSAAGFVDFNDLASSDAASTAAAREAQEEVGIEIDGSSISWIAVGRDMWAYGIGLAGVHLLTTRAARTKLSLSEEEVETCEWWEFEPEAIIRRWKTLGYWYAFVPLGGFALLQALANSYGADAVMHAYDRVGEMSRLPRS